MQQVGCTKFKVTGGEFGVAGLYTQIAGQPGKDGTHSFRKDEAHVLYHIANTWCLGDRGEVILSRVVPVSVLRLLCAVGVNSRSISLQTWSAGRQLAPACCAVIVQLLSSSDDAAVRCGSTVLTVIVLGPPPARPPARWLSGRIVEGLRQPG